MARSRRHSSLLVITPLIAALLAAYGLVVWVGGQSGHSSNARLSAAQFSAQLRAGRDLLPAKTCSSLASDTNLLTIPTYPTSIGSAKLVTATGTTPQYCDVTGMIAPQTQFSLELPTTTWNGSYVQFGCGGYCGVVSALTFPSGGSYTGDFAIATDDEGHTANTGLGGAGLFSFNDQQLRAEYGYVSEHALDVVAKTIIAAFYGKTPTKSYFDGCSDGGREAMEEAQRFPNDFTGIIAGAPEMIAGPLNAEEQTWNYKVNTNAQGNAILTDTKLPALHAAVVKKCGGGDGVPDGIITTPRLCDFTPASIQCAAGVNTKTCLTPAQVQVVREYYQGATSPTGKRLYPGGWPYGSETGWRIFELPPSNTGGTVPTTKSLDYFGLSLPYLRFQLLAPGQLGPTPSTWQFSVQDYNSMFPAANVQDAMSTNLSAFHAHGGKLIMWQGWADNAIPPTGTIDYYENLAKEVSTPTQPASGQSGPAPTNYTAAQQFARLFMFPTVYHCGGGYGGVTGKNLTLLPDLVNWVQNGKAPSTVVVNYTITKKSLSRPVYPYPDIPAYNGKGTPSAASSFHPVRSPAATTYVTWIGNHLFFEPDSTAGPPTSPRS